MTTIEIEQNGKKYRIQAEPVEEPWVPKVGDEVRTVRRGRNSGGSQIQVGWQSTVSIVYADTMQVRVDEDNRIFGGIDVWPIASLEPISEKVEEKSWGVDPNGTYVKGVTRFAVKAGAYQDIIWSDGGTGVFKEVSGGMFTLIHESPLYGKYGNYPANGKDFCSGIPASALRLIEPLAKPKPKDLQEWATATLFELYGYVARNPEQATLRCVQHFGGRMFKRAKVGEIYIDRQVDGWKVLDGGIIMPIRLATFPATASKESVEECLRLIQPYLNQITQ